jgi:CheY-like chemotaxis protein
MGFAIVGACFRVSGCYKVPLVQITQLSRPRTEIMSSADSNAAAASSNSLEKNHRALILVVERNPAVQRLERYFLEQAGFSVEFAADGATALERTIELQPRILVTEILVPELDGLSLCRQIKSNSSTNHILVLIFSHLHADERAFEAGADAFLMKPFAEDTLIETVENLLVGKVLPEQ